MPTLVHDLVLAHRRSSPEPVLPNSRMRFDLAGQWQRHVGGQLYDVIPVPSSQMLVGNYQLERTCALPALTGTQRAFLHFEGVNYFGRAFVNETMLGTMGPYVPYEFDMTRVAREGMNAIRVFVGDLRPEADGTGRDEIAMGNTNGWEAAGGIIRDVYIEYRSATFVENIRFSYTLNAPYTTASCRAQVMLDSSIASTGHVELSLLYGKTVIARADQDVAVVATTQEVVLTFNVEQPLLWTPETPNLYTLVATVRTSGGEDTYTSRTGFRDLRIDGRLLKLNGDRLVLRGICRHDLWKDQGFTLTRDQMRTDMRMIKSMGANYVRLVHYPHNRYIVELADELGLMVTEEPGVWNTFSFSPSAIAMAFRTLERLIHRDWNSPSVFAWLLGNECGFSLDYMTEGKALCKRVDPWARPVSVAQHEARGPGPYNEANLDYYTIHSYEWGPDKFVQYPESFGPSKPLIYDEGGWNLFGSWVPSELYNDSLIDTIEAGLVSGYAPWVWQDYRQYNCSDFRYVGGVLIGGITDEAHKPREFAFMELTRLFQQRRHEVAAPGKRPDPVPLRVPPWRPQTRLHQIDLQALVTTDAANAAWADLEAHMAKYWPTVPLGETHWNLTGAKLRFWSGPDIDIAGATFRCPVVDEYVRPIVLTSKNPSVTIPIGRSCRQLHVLGHVMMPSAINGKRGNTAAVYTIHYASGQSQRIPLRHGIELAQANLIHNATQIDPIATAAPRALVYTKHVTREHYQILLCSLPLKGKRVDRVQVTLNPDQSPLLLFAMNAEEVSP